MTNSSFSQLTPTGFLQTFVIELMHACEEAGVGSREQLIEQIAVSASRFFEEAYRQETSLQGKLDIGLYVELITGLKNKIGGNFTQVVGDNGCIRLVSSRCPFGEGVMNSPELCRMTSSVFGGIAARNFGYAKVVLEKRIALGDDTCQVDIHLNRADAKLLKGLDYLPPSQAGGSGTGMNELQARIEERMHRIWCQMSGRIRDDDAVKAPLIVAESPAMQKVLRAIETVAPTPATVSIRGETGVGKELVARAIHAMSDRCQKPFVAVNCGAIPEGIVESLMFGHEKGAFTGASEVHQGYFERAHGGTLFLDEIDSLTPAVQSRLLRVIQEGELERVGGHRTLHVDTRIVSATNCDLEHTVAAGRFRKDLYYRINVVKLVIPPLAERREDIPRLVDTILQRLAKRYNKPAFFVTPEVMALLCAHAWPGNVRELENTLERAALFAKSLEITEIDTASPVAAADIHWKDVKKETLVRLERDYLEQALRRAQGKVNTIADWMELSPRAVYQKLSAHGMDPAAYRARRETE